LSDLLEKLDKLVKLLASGNYKTTRIPEICEAVQKGADPADFEAEMEKILEDAPGVKAVST